MPKASEFGRAGCWAPAKNNIEVDRNEALEHIPLVLLRRYGVVFRKVLKRATCR